MGFTPHAAAAICFSLTLFTAVHGAVAGACTDPHAATFEVIDSLDPSGRVQRSVGVSTCGPLDVRHARLVCRVEATVEDIALPLQALAVPLTGVWAHLFPQCQAGTATCFSAVAPPVVDIPWGCTLRDSDAGGGGAAADGAGVLWTLQQAAAQDDDRADTPVAPGIDVRGNHSDLAQWLVPAVDTQGGLDRDYQQDVLRVVAAGGGPAAAPNGTAHSGDTDHPKAAASLLEHLAKDNATDPFVRSQLNSSLAHVRSLATASTGGHLHTHRVVREFMGQFLETHGKVASSLRVGVSSQEVFALIVDQIMNSLPEVLLQILIAVMRGLFVSLMGELLVVLVPPLLIPNDGAIAPPLPGLPPPVPKPPKPCECVNKAGETYTPTFQRFTSRCVCEAGDALLEQHASVTAAAGGGTQAGAGVGATAGMGEPKLGPLERITEKAKETVPAGLEAEAMPATFDGIAEQLKVTLEATMPEYVARGTIRKLIRSLTASLTSSLLSALLELVATSTTLDVTKAAAKQLIPTLTLSIGTSIAQSLSRSPESDYFCKYCSSADRYCEQCNAAKRFGQELDARITRYARHFGAHYAQVYSGDTAEELVAEVLRTGQLEPPFVPVS